MLQQMMISSLILTQAERGALFIKCTAIDHLFFCATFWLKTIHFVASSWNHHSLKQDFVPFGEKESWRVTATMPRGRSKTGACRYRSPPGSPVQPKSWDPV